MQRIEDNVSRKRGFVTGAERSLLVHSTDYTLAQMTIARHCPFKVSLSLLSSPT